MLRIFKITAVIAVLLSISLLTSCNFGISGNKKQVPVYQGMYLLDSPNVATPTGVTNGNGNNGNKPVLPPAASLVPGEFLGNTEKQPKAPDPRHPFGEDSDPTDIADAAQDALEVLGGEKALYYTEKNADVYFVIRLSNPDNFEILSFTLNGKKFASYMFEPGSNMERLILKYNVGDNIGFQDYTIDAIKYIDGTEIKDALIGGDQTVTAGIYSDRQPAATFSNAEIAYNSLSVDVKIDDPMNLIAKSRGEAKVVLFDGQNVVDTKDIAVGETARITFTGLVPATLYQYAVVAGYDDLLGAGTAVHTIGDGAFYTDAALWFENVNVESGRVTFNVAKNPETPDATVTALSLYDGDTKIKDIATSATEVGELRSDHAYTLEGTYTVDGKTSVILLGFTTFHTLSFVEAVAPDYRNEGTIAHYRCDICHRMYSDESATDEYTASNIRIPSLIHNIQPATAVAVPIEGAERVWEFTLTVPTTGIYKIDVNDVNQDDNYGVLTNMTLGDMATPFRSVNDIYLDVCGYSAYLLEGENTLQLHHLGTSSSYNVTGITATPIYVGAIVAYAGLTGNKDEILTPTWQQYSATHGNITMPMQDLDGITAPIFAGMSLELNTKLIVRESATYAVVPVISSRYSDIVNGSVTLISDSGIQIDIPIIDLSKQQTATYGENFVRGATRMAMLNGFGEYEIPAGIYTVTYRCESSTSILGLVVGTFALQEVAN